MGSAAGILAVANGGTGSSTASTGTGGVVLSNSPTLVAPSLGVPAFIDLTNARYLPLDGAIAVTGKLPIAFGGTNALATPTAGAVPYGTGTAYAFTGVGTAGQVLTSAGAGIPTWTTVTTSAGGSNTQLQYNSSGSFAGSANMTFNGTTLALNSLSVTNNVTAPTFLGQVTFSNNWNPGIVIGNGTSDTGISFNSTSYSSISVGNGGTFWVKNAGGTNFLSANVTAVSIPLTTASTSTSTGALVVVGGVGVGGALVVGSTMTTPNITSLLTTANTYPTTRPSLNLDFANSATLDPRITFTRGTNATYIGSDGLVKNTAGINSPRFDWDPVTRECKGLLIEEARTNLYTYSEQFDNAVWLKVNITCIPEIVITPSGQLAGDAFIESTAASSFHYVNCTQTKAAAVKTYTYSIYVKDKGRYISLGFSDNVANGVAGVVNPATGTISSVAGSYGTGWIANSLTITAVNNGWYRVVFTFTSDAISTSLGTQLSFYNPSLSTNVYTGDGISGAYIWGAQLEEGAFATSYIPSSVTWTGRASTATYVGSNGLIQTAASGVARYQYNPTNLSVAPFLLLEPAATNLFPYSESLAGGGGGGTRNLDAGIIDPAGNTNTVYYCTTSEWTTVFNGGSATTISVSFFAKLRTGSGVDYIRLEMFQSVTGTVVNIGTYDFYLSATNADSGYFKNITRTAYPNGWYRFTCNVVANTSAAAGYNYFTVASRLDIEGSASSNYIWGIQVETGSVATSYIPTVASQVTRIADTSTSAQTTRSADVATMTNSNFSSWYNQTEGTFVLKTDIIQRSSGTTYPRIIAAVGTDYNNDEICIYTVTTGATAGLPNTAVTTSGIQTFGGYVAVPTTYAWTAAIAYKTNDANSSSNGSLIGNSDTSVTLPICTELRIFGVARYQPMSSGHIAKLTYYPTRLSNSTLQALTT
jgi:hypothetical protein